MNELDEAEKAMTVEVLEDRVETLENEVARYREYLPTLNRIIDRLAEIGLIESDPHTKMLYREGKRVI